MYVTQYKPFGQEYATSGSYASLKYTGQWRDSNTGLYYLYRRFYDPDLGRFLSPDPILGHLTVPQSLDRYLYTVNNPLRYVDPTGEDSWSPFALIGAALNAAGQALSKINPVDLLDMKEDYWKQESKKSSGDYSSKDLERMEQGKAQMGSDGYPMELHHMDGTPTGGLKPMTRTEHRLGENYLKNHPWVK